MKRMPMRLKKSTLIFLALGLLLFHALLGAQENDDHLIANRIFSKAYEAKLAPKPIGEVMVFVGKQFLGAPYEAGTLDRPAAESLVVDLHTFDCVTFVENVLALARCIKEDKLSFDAYRAELERIRYRGGKLDGYPSRFHYFSEWIRENEKKKIVRDVTKSLGGKPYDKAIRFMTTHRSSYPKLQNDSTFNAIKAMEDSVAAMRLYYIPKAAIQKAIKGIKDGDIIAFTSSVEGLDISHTGIAVRVQDETVHLLHAPDVGEKVRITEEPLSTYIQRHPKQTGIMVARAEEP